MPLPRPARRALLRLRRRLPVRCPPGWRTGPPDFIGLGAQKCATTWWHHLIESHPGVQPVRAKESHALRSHPLPLTRREVARYHAGFPRPFGQQCGEWTPGYLADAWALDRIHEAAPGARLLVNLRDPIERYRSAIAMLARQGKLATDWELAARHRGLYAHQLKRLFDRVERSQVLVLQFERLVADPWPSLAATYRFLGLDDAFVPSDLAGRRNPTPGGLPVLDDRRLRELRELYEPDVAALADLDLDLDLDLWISFAHQT